MHLDSVKQVVRKDVKKLNSMPGGAEPGPKLVKRVAQLLRELDTYVQRALKQHHILQLIDDEARTFFSPVLGCLNDWNFEGRVSVYVQRARCAAVLLR